MQYIYGAIFLLSLIMLHLYFVFVRGKQNNPWLFSLFVCVSVVNFGYMLLSLSKTVEFALIANKIAYLGQAFIILCMFMIIFKLCGFTLKKWLAISLLCIAVIMYAMVLTTGHLDWYYKSVDLIFVDGSAKLVKEYGVLHTVYLIYVLSYFATMPVLIITSLIKKRVTSGKLAGLMLAVVFGNIGVWLVEQCIRWNFEFLAISYLMSELVFFFIYWMMKDYIHVDKLPMVEGQDIVDISKIPMDVKIQRALKGKSDLESLASREREVLELILQNKKRKEIAEQMHLSENTIKTYTRNLYGKLDVADRDELYKRILQE